MASNEADQFNDTTFGGSSLPSTGNNLPSFFHNPGSTVVDQFASWNLNVNSPPPPGMEPLESTDRSNLYSNASDYSASQESYYKKKEIPQNNSPPLPPGAKSFDNYDKMASNTFDHQRYQQTIPRTQVLQSGPGVLPPPQSLASLSTPGSGATWHAGYVSKGRDSSRAPQQGRGGHYPHYPPSIRGNNNSNYSTPQKPSSSQSQGQGQGQGHSQGQHNNNQGRGNSPGQIHLAPLMALPIDLRPSSGNQPVPPPFSGGGAPIIVTPQTSQPRQVQRQFGNNLPTGTLMNSSDVKFVVSKVLQMTETQDPYNDDFYFIQMTLKKNNKKIQDAIITNSPPPPLLPVPLPTWTETQVRVKKHVEETRRHFEDRSRAWEEKEGVLGHVVKTDIKAPKTVLSFSSASKTDGEGEAAGDENEEIESERIVPFAGVVWTMRQAAYRGFTALYTVHELQTLLLTPLVAASPLIRDEILEENSRCQTLLSKSVGVRVTEHTSTPASTLQIDGGLAAALLQTTKGKKLMKRSLALIPANQRWTLIPIIVSRVLQRDPSEQSSEDIEAEASLLDLVGEFVNCEYHALNELSPPPGLSSPIVMSKGYDAEEMVTLLSRLRQSIKSVVIAQMEKPQLRHAFMSNRRRTEVMQAILRLGDRVVESVGQDSKRADWEQLRETFLQLLEE